MLFLILRLDFSLLRDKRVHLNKHTADPFACFTNSVFHIGARKFFIVEELDHDRVVD